MQIVVIMKSPEKITFHPDELFDLSQAEATTDMRARQVQQNASS